MCDIPKQPRSPSARTSVCRSTTSAPPYTPSPCSPASRCCADTRQAKRSAVQHSKGLRRQGDSCTVHRMIRESPRAKPEVTEGCRPLQHPGLQSVALRHRGGV